jgi:hypothetical protein
VSMASGSSSLEPALIVLGLLVLLMARRTYLMVRGAPVRPGRLAVFAAFYVGLFVLTLAATSVGTPWYLYALDGAILLAASGLATGYVRDHVHLERRPPAQEWYYRLHPWVPLSYMVLFVSRIAIALWVLGPSAIGFAVAPAVSLPPGAALLLDVVDALFGLSTGILVGRSVGVYLAYESAVARERASTGRPLATGVPPPPPSRSEPRPPS